jgi:hypothetical protein
MSSQNPGAGAFAIILLGTVLLVLSLVIPGHSLGTLGDEVCLVTIVGAALYLLLFGYLRARDLREMDEEVKEDQAKEHADLSRLRITGTKG